MRSLFCLFVLLLLVPTCVFSSQEEKTGRLHSVQADFTQETHMKILARPLVSHGTFAFQAPDSLRWEYRTPLHSIMLMHNGSMVKMIEKDGRMQQDKGMGNGSIGFILPEISNWLDGRFADNRVFKVAHKEKRTIILTPKEEGLASVISSIELHLGKQEGVMDSVTIFEGADAFTRLTFSTIVVNRKIPESTFSKP